MPARILDLYVEFRMATNLGNGPEDRPYGSRLPGALRHFEFDGMAVEEKDDMIALILRSGPELEARRDDVLDYCQSDVDALAKLLLPILGRIPALGPALFRGRYMAAVAAMYHNGVPIDMPLLEQLDAAWDGIKDKLIAEVDADFGVYEGRSFRAERFAQYLMRTDTPWPRLESGELDLDKDTFRQVSKYNPAIRPLHELRSTLGKLRLNSFVIGQDGRNRAGLWPFKAKTSRNLPSNTEFIFGPSRWMRGLIKPPPGHAVAYIDWEQQEVGIAAVLSGDSMMLAAYESGDSYLGFAKQAGAVPPGATENSHPHERSLYKQATLATQYHQGWESLAGRIGGPPAIAQALLRAHHETYRKFWAWSDNQVNLAIAKGHIDTVLGWRLHTGSTTTSRSLANYPMQANAADMMRLAACLATERGIEVCAPIHDAFLVMAPIERIEADVARMQAAMAEASRVVLDGFELRSKAEIVRWPDRYMDDKGAEMWRRAMGLLDGQA